MSRRTLGFALLSSLLLTTGACKSMLEPTASGVADRQGVDDTTQNGTVGGQGAVGDDHGGLTGGHGADDPAGDDRGGLSSS
jgi:hypothetical protein